MRRHARASRFARWCFSGCNSAPCRSSAASAISRQKRERRGAAPASGGNWDNTERRLASLCNGPAIPARSRMQPCSATRAMPVERRTQHQIDVVDDQRSFNRDLDPLAAGLAEQILRLGWRTMFFSIGRRGQGQHPEIVGVPQRGHVDPLTNLGRVQPAQGTDAVTETEAAPPICTVTGFFMLQTNCGRA